MPISTINNDSFADTAVHGQRNLIINGACTISQRGVSTSFAHDGTTNGFTVDRFNFLMSNCDQLDGTLTQASDAPDGFTKSLKWATGTAESTIDANELVYIRQKIEAQDLQHLQYGNSGAKSLTLSFYVKSSQTGTFGITIFTEDGGSRQITKTYAVSASNTWQKKEISIEGDTSGIIDDNNGYGLGVHWMLAAGSDFTSNDSTSWGAYTNGGLAYGHAQNGVITTASATFQITGVQLEVGEATPFEHRSFGDELARCQRYGWRIAEGLPKRVATGTWNNSTSADILCPLPVQMRAVPTLTVASNGSLLDFAIAWHNVTSVTLSGESSNRLVSLICSVASSGAAQGDGAAWGAIGGNNPDAFLDAEL